MEKNRPLRGRFTIIPVLLYINFKVLYFASWWNTWLSNSQDYLIQHFLANSLQNKFETKSVVLNIFQFLSI